MDEQPHVKGLEKFTEYMAEQHDLNVRQVYYPGLEIDGTWIEGEWMIHVYLTTELEDGRIWYHGTTISTQLVNQGKQPGWDALAELIKNEPVP